MIANELRERIEAGIIPPGSLLPAESALTAEFRVSRGTIRQAIAILREAGAVVTAHGRGTHVVPRRRESRPDEDSETETRRRQVKADPELAALFAVEVGTALVEQESVTRTNGAVGKVIRSYRLFRTRQ
ncbi:GntR family transcriptional regulator [Micromonospora sp. A202]|uniref:GntR family transcriptional regulator n=1 Tax=Micromonospora sp. A202 TaxID=2572899 RepID=UPI003519E7A5